MEYMTGTSTPLLGNFFWFVGFVALVILAIFLLRSILHKK
jgi:hypothetical protein